MIRAEDLMIGDWVRMKENQKIAFQMEDISGTGMFKRWTSDGEYMIPYAYDEIEPVPLTPEILEKNGLKEDNKYGHGYWYIERLGGYIGQTVSSTTPIEIGYDNGHCVVSNPHIGRVYQGGIEYVHELQHALRLCGINLKITV